MNFDLVLGPSGKKLATLKKIIILFETVPYGINCNNEIENEILECKYGIISMGILRLIDC